MPGPVTTKEIGAVSRMIGKRPTDETQRYRKEALLKWLRERESRSTNVRPPYKNR